MSTAVQQIAEPRKATGRFYRPELDGLRFLAFLMVFVHHASGTNVRIVQDIKASLGFGVAIFFLLSAYLITELLLREREETGTIQIGNFFLRRILRIWPLYFLGLALGTLFGAILPEFHVPLGALPYFLLLVGNLYPALHGWKFGAILILWSISIEEQFYLAVPALARSGGSTILRRASYVVLAASYVALLVLGTMHVNPREVVWVNSFVQFQFFAAGTLLAIHLHRKAWKLAPAIRCILLAVGLIGIAITETVFKLQDNDPLSSSTLCFGYLIALVSCIAIFLSVLGISSRYVPSWLRYLGRISFGLYVYHAMALDLSQHIQAKHWLRFSGSLRLLDAAALGLTILAATLSYELFESKILKLKQRFAVVRSGAPPGVQEAKR